MSVLSILVLSLGFAISCMVAIKHCAEEYPVRLTYALLVATMMAAFHAALFLLGVWIGDELILRSAQDDPILADYNAYIFLGFAAVVGLRWLWPYLRRTPRENAYNLKSLNILSAMSLGRSISGFIVGIGAGMVGAGDRSWVLSGGAMFVAVWLLTYFGIMLGRQHVKMRPRRWMILASVLLIGCAVAAVVNAN